jgi:hypothetical protein
VWCSEAEAFPGAVIQSMHRQGDVFFCDGSEAHFLRKELPDQPVHVLVGAAFPGGIGMGEEEVCAKLFGNPFMLCKLLAVVSRQRMRCLYIPGNFDLAV